MTPEPLRDETARKRAIDEIDRSFAIEAGAGTGKTTILVSRLVELVRKGVDLDRVVAITFTEKAAGELKQRFRDALEARFHAAAAPGDVERFRAALDEVEGAAITTIHGFCASILRERPVEAKVDPGFQVAEPKLIDTLFEEALLELFDESGSHDPTPLLEAFAAGLSMDALRRLARAVIENRDLVVDPAFTIDAVEPPSPDRLSDAFASLVSVLRESSSACSAEDDKMFEQITRLADLRERLFMRPESEVEFELLAIRPRRGKVGAKTKWRDERALETCREALASFMDEQERYAKRRLAHRAMRLQQVLVHLPRLYDAVKERRGLLDFQDLLIRTRDLLKHDLDVRRTFKERFATVLLDEFQDTDPLQAEIAFFLAEDSAAEPARDWTDVHVGAGRLFLVGDPKQSIYRFRRADVEVYEAAKERILASGGDVLTISVNFRSAPAVLGWVNECFGRLIQPASEDVKYQPTYEPILAAPGTRDVGPGVVLLGDSEGDLPGKADDARVAEATSIAAHVRRLVGADGGAPTTIIERKRGELVERAATYRDCAILFRGTTALGIYEKALRANEVPYRVGAGRHLYSRSEVKAAVALFRAVDDPADEPAQLAVLRGPLFGVSDTDLLRFRNAGGRFFRLSHDPPGAPESLCAARSLLRELHRRRHRVGLASFVVEILTRTRAFELFHMKPMGEQRVANLRLFIDRARAFEAAGATFRAFVDDVRRQEEQSSDEAESPLMDASDDAVQLLTMHIAKGLEFPIVVLADLNARPTAGDRWFFERAPALRFEFSMKKNDEAILETDRYEEAKTRDKARDDAERRRILYVAATRATSLLVVPRFTYASGAKKEEKVDGFLDLLRDDSILDREASEAAGRFVDAHTLDRRTGDDRAFRLDLDPDAPMPAVATRVLAERRELTERLGSLLGDPRHARAVTSPTAQKDPVDHRFAESLDAPRSRSRGIAFGTYVHRLLELIDLERPEEGLAENARGLAGAEGCPGEFADDAVAIVRNLIESDLWRRLTRARRVEREVPFVFDAGGTLLEGAIDLVAEEADGRYLIVDWKTDDVAGAALAGRLDRYRSQGEAYARAVLVATGRDVSDVLFAFVRTGEVAAL